MSRDHIIVVDDESVIAKILARQLAPFAAAYEVSAITSGRTALDFVGRCEARGESIALVIADQVMPEVSGVALLERTHLAFPDAAKILLTGHGNIDVVARALNNAGLDRYIGKPWEEADLLVTVETLLSRRKQQRESERLLADLGNQVALLQRQKSELEAQLRAKEAELTRLRG